MAILVQISEVRRFGIRPRRTGQEENDENPIIFFPTLKGIIGFFTFEPS